MNIMWEAGPVVYTRNQAEGALPNGTRIEKVNSEPGDGHQDGAAGKVIGSLQAVPSPGFPERYVYFVAFDENPAAGVPVGIVEGRVKVWEEGNPMDGRLRFQIVVDILIDQPALKKACEQEGRPMLEIVQRIAADFVAGTVVKEAGMEFRLASGPRLDSP